MTSQPDKLFRDKLENFQRPAPAGAWDKIEQKLEKPTYKVVWMRVAAGIILLSVAAVLLWPAERVEQNITKTQEELPVKKNKVKKQLPKPAKEKIAEPKRVSPVQTTHTASVKKTSKQSSEKKSETVVQDSVSGIVPEAQPQQLVAEVTQPEINQPVSTAIVYTADEVNSKFIKKKLLPEATPATKEASGIQKLIGLAYSAKNSESGLGNLRQKKDEILTLNFNKKKGEN